VFDRCGSSCDHNGDVYSLVGFFVCGMMGRLLDMISQTYM
jgi:hypothetical protein